MSSLSGCSPCHLFGDRDVGAPMIHRAGKEPCLGLHPAPVLTQSLKQILTKRHVAIPSALAFPDMDDHPFAVNVGDFEPAHLRSAPARRIQGHEHGAMV